MGILCGMVTRASAPCAPAPCVCYTQTMHRTYLRQLIAPLLAVALAAGALMGYRALVSQAQPEPHGIELHFIDVGDADATLVMTGGKAMLVDGGFPESGEVVALYLMKQGVTSLDVMVSTHPHNDHMGGLETILSEYDVGVVYGGPARSDRRVFRRFEDALESKGLTVEAPKPGFAFDLGSARVTVLSPSRLYDELNNMSLVLRVDYGDAAFLLQADALFDAEFDMLASGLPLAADLVRIGHHGSNDATSDEYLDAVSPDFAVISCDADKPNRPHRKTLERLERAGVSVYRTDTMGTVVARCDGKEIVIDVEFENCR